MNILETSLGNFLGQIQALLTYLAGTICIISIIVAGIMWAWPSGTQSERRTMIAQSALYSAIVGFIIVLLAPTIAGSLQTLFH